jgi:hypothetical protein
MHRRTRKLELWQIARSDGGVDKLVEIYARSGGAVVNGLNPSRMIRFIMNQEFPTPPRLAKPVSFDENWRLMPPSASPSQPS